MFEALLEGHKYLVAENKTLADLSVYPNLDMSELIDFDFSPICPLGERVCGRRLPMTPNVNVKPIQELKTKITAAQTSK
jgi:glutathione S-transferase